MTLPTEPGRYEDIVGDIWTLGVDGLWQHDERRMSDGELSRVYGRFTGRMTPEAFEHAATGPSVSVFPLVRIGDLDR